MTNNYFRVMIERKHSTPVLLLSLGALLLVQSCSSSRKTTRPVVQHISLDTLSVTAKPLSPDRYNPSEPRIWDITHSRVALQFDWKNKTADGREWIDLHPYFYDADSIVLDAKGMRIDTVNAELRGKRLAVRYRHEDDKLRIALPSTLTDADSLRLYLRYTAMPYGSAAGGSAAISEDRGLYFINTDNSIPNKPAQIWTQGETQANSHWMPTFDQPNERFTTQVELTVPDEYTTLGNGALLKSSRNGAMRTDVWSIDKPIQAYAVMFAVGRFSVVKDSWRGKEVSYYVEPEYASYARDMFQHTPQMMEHFSQITGIPYPWNKYSQVVVRDYVSGAMENTTASLFGEFMNQTSREIRDKNFEDVVSHELFHQWFGDYVTAESWANLTVNESFADYGESLWRKHQYGKDNADQHLWENLNKYLSQTQQKDPALVRFNYEDREDMFDRISYEKGGSILHYLHGLMGDAAFYRAMNLYLSKNALQPAEAHQWRLAVEEATGLDWNWFFNQWYFRGGHPELKVRYQYADSANKLIVYVDQAQKGSSFAYRLPLKTLVVTGNQRKLVEWHLNKRHEVFEYPYQGGEKPLVVPDIDHWLVGTLKEDKKNDLWLRQFTQSGDYLSKRTAVREAFNNKNETGTEIYRKAVRDTSALIREYAFDKLSGLSSGQKWAETFTPEALYAAEHDASNLVRAAALEALGKWKVNSAAGPMMQAVSDSSYVVSGAALRALSEIAPDTAYRLAKTMIATNPRAGLESAIWSVLANRANAADIAYFEQQKDRVYGSRRLGMAHYIQTYAGKTESTESFRRAANLLQQLAGNESIKSYRFYLGTTLGGIAMAQQQKLKSADAANKVNIQERFDAARDAFRKLLANEKDKENREGLEESYKSLK